MRLKRSKASGFTLIELGMAIIIISILAASTLPKFFSVSTYQQTLYNDQVLNTLRYARKLAVGSGSHIQVSLTSNSITLQRRTEGSACTTGTAFSAITDPTFSSSGYVKTAPGSVTLSASANWPIYFDGLGQARQASNCAVVSSATVTVSGNSAITVLGTTGWVK